MYKGKIRFPIITAFWFFVNTTWKGWNSLLRKTKIICTLGPAVDSEDKLRLLIENGMDCARFNFSHGTHEEQKTRMDRLRKVCREIGTQIPILLDTKGPEVRLLTFENGSAEIASGDLFTFFGDNRTGTKEGVGLSFPGFARHVRPGMTILADDGHLSFTVERIEGEDTVCRVVTGGTVRDRKSINLPGYDIPMPFIGEKDREDLLFGIREDVDFVAASFVRSGDDVRALRSFLNENGGENIKIISKIESLSGIANLEEILSLSDGIMVARGDLGVETDFQKLPDLQKKIILLCLRAGKHCVIATQMLDSMTHAPRPTRAEVSDVANAIYDGTTAIMLSGETAAGEYPVEAVRAMAEIASYTESTIDTRAFNDRVDFSFLHDIPSTIARSACDAAQHLDLKAIVAVTRSGNTAERIACFRPACPILALTVSEKACRQLRLSWGVQPLKADEKTDFRTLYAHTLSLVRSTGIVGKGDRIAIVSGSSFEEKYSCMLTLHLMD